MDSDQDKTQVLHVSFNQDFSCFAVGTTRGFKVYHTRPLRLVFERGTWQVEFNGGLGIVELVYRCNIVALVGGGPTPRYPLNKVMLWDDHQMRCIGEICFRSEVRGVRLRRDLIVVVLTNKLYVYTLSDLHLKDNQETWVNSRGLCALSSGTDAILAFPDRPKGRVKVMLYTQDRNVSIDAHESAVACLALSVDGSLLASASDKGTLIRIFTCTDGNLLQEVRRGIDRADICSLCFDPSKSWFACTSDKGTVHVFSVRQAEEEKKTSFVKKLLPKYFDSEWSFSKFSLPETHAICGFGETAGTVVAVSLQGSFYSASFDPRAGGEGQVVSSHSFLELR